MAAAVAANNDPLNPQSTNNTVLLALSDTIHDTWKGYRNDKAQENDDAAAGAAPAVGHATDAIRAYLENFIKAKYGSVAAGGVDILGNIPGAGHCRVQGVRMQQLLSNCFTGLQQRHITPSDIEDQTIAYFNTYTNLRNKNVEMTITYADILARVEADQLANAAVAAANAALEAANTALAAAQQAEHTAARAAIVTHMQAAANARAAANAAVVAADTADVQARNALAPIVQPYRNADSIVIKDTVPAIFGTLTPDQSRTISNFIEEYLYPNNHNEFGITFDSHQSTIFKIVGYNRRARNLMTPQNIADSANTLTQSFRNGSAYQYRFPTQSYVAYNAPPPVAAADAAAQAAAARRFISRSTIFSDDYKIVYEMPGNLPFDDTNRHGFQFKIVNNAYPADPTNLANQIISTLGNGVTQGPSLNYLLELHLTAIARQGAANQADVTALAAIVPSTGSQMQIGTSMENNPAMTIEIINQIRTHQSSILLDIKRAGDWDQIDAAKRISDGLPAGPAGAVGAIGAVPPFLNCLATTDREAALRARIMGKNVMLQANKQITVFRVEVNRNIAEEITKKIEQIRYNIDMIVKYRRLIDNTLVRDNLLQFIRVIYDQATANPQITRIHLFMKTLRLCDMYEFLLPYYNILTDGDLDRLTNLVGLTTEDQMIHGVHLLNLTRGLNALGLPQFQELQGNLTAQVRDQIIQYQQQLLAPLRNQNQGNNNADLMTYLGVLNGNNLLPLYPPNLPVAGAPIALQVLPNIGLSDHNHQVVQTKIQEQLRDDVLEQISEHIQNMIAPIHAFYATRNLSQQTIISIIDIFNPVAHAVVPQFDPAIAYHFLNYDPELYTTLETCESIINVLVTHLGNRRKPYEPSEFTEPATNFNECMSEINDTFQSVKEYALIPGIRLPGNGHTLKEYIEHIRLFINIKDITRDVIDRSTAISRLFGQINTINLLITGKNEPSILFTHIIGNITLLPHSRMAHVVANAKHALTTAESRQGSHAAINLASVGLTLIRRYNLDHRNQKSIVLTAETSLLDAKYHATNIDKYIKQTKIRPVHVDEASHHARLEELYREYLPQLLIDAPVARAFANAALEAVQHEYTYFQRLTGEYLADVNVAVGEQREQGVQGQLICRRDVIQDLHTKAIDIQEAASNILYNIQKALRQQGGGGPPLNPANDKSIENTLGMTDFDMDEPVMQKQPVNPYFHYIEFKKICHEAAEWFKGIISSLSDPIIRLNCFYIELLGVYNEMIHNNVSSMMNHANNVILYCGSNKNEYTALMDKIITKNASNQSSTIKTLETMLSGLKKQIDLLYDDKRTDLIKSVYAKNEMSIMMRHFYKMKYDWDFEMRIHEGQPDGITSYFEYFDPINTMVSFALLSEELDGAIAQDRSIISKICGYTPEVSLTHDAAWSELVDRLSVIYQKQILTEHTFEKEVESEENEFKSEVENEEEEFKSEENEFKSKVKPSVNNAKPSLPANTPVGQFAQAILGRGGNRTRKHRGHKTQRKKHGARKTKSKHSKRRFGTQRKKQNRK